MKCHVYFAGGNLQ